MIITADIAMYPLDERFVEPIVAFIHALRRHDGIEVVTNQMSTQVRGEFEAVNAAVNAAMKAQMAGERKVVFVVRYLNSDLDIAERPDID